MIVTEISSTILYLLKLGHEALQCEMETKIDYYSLSGRQ